MIGGCFMSTLLAAIRARELEISGVGVEVVAEPVGTPPRFEKVEVWVSAVAPDRGALEKVVGIAAQGCIMVNTLRGTKSSLRLGSYEQAENSWRREQWGRLPWPRRGLRRRGPISCS